MDKKIYSGMKVTIMGLGLHGGGLESARYLALHGAECTVTDLRDEKTLAPSLEKLENPELRGRIRYVLGRHEMEDFSHADMVIKNPGVRPDSPYLAGVKRIETDISLFLAASPARLHAVTGSKGKSGTASALHWVVQAAHERPAGSGWSSGGKAYLGGNITVSPLTFLDELSPGDDVVLELSSWQLGDLKNKFNSRGEPLLKPRTAILTAILPDHLDRYGAMEAYVRDKRIIYSGQDNADATIAPDDPWGRGFLEESRGRPLPCSDLPLPGDLPGGWIEQLPGGSAGFVRTTAGGKAAEAVPPVLLVPGKHQKKNLLEAALALCDLGLSPAFTGGKLRTFPGIEHRLEFFREIEGIRFYNDTAATIPEAAAAAVEALADDPQSAPPILVAGGSDKNLDFTPLIEAIPKTGAVLLLAGTGSERIHALLGAAGISCQNPFDSVKAASEAALEAAKILRKKTGLTVPVLFSPGCASYGRLLNEFDRGRQWKEAVRNLS
jgi:UDP-N-acetylmuramoylalanine--D-glutamate ligase